MLRGLAVLVCAWSSAGCGTAPPNATPEASTTSTGGASSDTSSSDASSGGAYTSSATDDDTLATLSVGTLEGDSSGSQSDTTPYPVECEEPIALIEVTTAITPDGPLMITQGWLGSGVCGGPYVVLVGQDGLEVTVIFDEGPADDEPYLGTYPATLQPDVRGASIGTIEVLEPFFAPEIGVANPANHLHAQIELHEEGWDLSIEVDFLDCGEWTCFCPCR